MPAYPIKQASFFCFKMQEANFFLTLQYRKQKNELPKLKNEQIYSAIKWSIATLSIIYLGYKLYNYDYPEKFGELLAVSISSRANYLWLCVLLLPFNLLTETLKWKTLTANTQTLSNKMALQSVLAGFSTGFISPNRSAEFVGRALYFAPYNRVSILALNLCNGATLNLVIAIIGIVSIVFSTTQSITQGSNNSVYILIITLLAMAMVFVFNLPQIAKKLSKIKFLKSLLNGLSMLNQKQILAAITYSVIRYAIFCIQFYLMLQFLSINIPIAQAIWTIPTYYFMVTFTPTIAFGEITVRSAYAVVVLSSFANHNAALLAFAGFAMWLINFATPMILFYLTQLTKNVFGKQNLKQ